MNVARWEQIKNLVKEKFGSVVERQEADAASQETAEILEFDGPLGKMKLAFTTRPKILDKKTTYSNRVGSEVKVDYVFSAEENVQHLQAYRWNEASNDWQEVDSAMFS
jgi:hypothetical protein